jgi:hypothetical protein
MIAWSTCQTPASLLANILYIFQSMMFENGSYYIKTQYMKANK